MRTMVALLFVVGSTLSLVAQSRPADKKTPLAAKAAPAAADDSATKDPKKKEEPPAKIEGMEIARSGGGFLGLKVVNGTFKMFFYDAKKKATTPNVARAILRWDGKYKAPPERVVLTAGGPNTFISERTVKPPYKFRLSLLLLPDAPEGTEPAGENYNVDFAQD